MTRVFDLVLWQYIFFPIVVLSFLSVRLLGVKAPKAFLAVALIPPLLNLGSIFSYRWQSSPSLLLAQLSGEETGAQTHMFMRRLDRYLGAYGRNWSHDLKAKVADRQRADEILDGASAGSVLIWGNLDTLNGSFSGDAGKRILSWPQGGEGSLSSFSFERILDVPGLSISLSPRNATADFFASFFTGISLYSREHGLVNAEGFVRNAASIVSPWTGSTHKAYPWWWLGSRYLESAISNPLESLGELHCARFYFKKAREYVAGKDNLPLYVTVLNDLAISEAMIGFFEARAKESRAAESHLQFARRAIGPKPESLQLARNKYVVVENLKEARRLMKENKNAFK